MKKTIQTCLLAITAASANAAVMTNPTLATGPDSIDPAGGALDATATVSGAETKAGLTSTTGFGVIQSFTGLNTAATGTVVNYVDFTSGSNPDIRLTSLSFNGSGGAQSNNFTTSAGTSFFIGSGGFTGVGQKALIIDFGSFTSPSTFTADSAVSALGFMVTTAAKNLPRTITATFFDSSNGVLDTQTFSNAPASSALLFGHIEPTNAISRVELTVTNGTGTDTDNGLFIDDLGFAVIPEPSVALLSFVSLGLLLRRRR